MPETEHQFSWPAALRAGLIVVFFFGLDCALNCLENGRPLPGNPKPADARLIGWPALLAAWWMAILHLPVPAYHWCKNVPLNAYFSNETVFRAMFGAWYGCMGLIGLLAVALGSRYGGPISLVLLLGIILAGRGLRLRRLVEYGSTCASLLVMAVVADEIPGRLWLWCYAGIGLVQMFFLTILDSVLAQIFPAEAPESAGIQH